MTPIEKTPIIELYSVLDQSDRALVLDYCINAYMARSYGMFASRVDFPYGTSTEDKLKLLNRAVQAKIAELTAYQKELEQMAAGKDLQSTFLQSPAGKTLSTAWNALLEGDVATLPTITGYATNDVGIEDVSRQLFWKLVTAAGIELFCGGWGGGAERHGNFTFVLGDKGLYVAYDHVGGHSRDSNDKTYTAAVVTGTLVTAPRRQFNQTGEANAEPQAVKDMAAAVAAKLIEHYGSKH